MQTTIDNYSLGFTQSKTYLLALAFVMGNILLPQLCHLMPDGGLIFLPIYFFTLVGAYKYGSCVGLLTAVASPLVNSALFGMPAPAALPAILMKSVLLAVFASLAASKFKSASLLVILAVVLSYQVVGTLGEWMMKGDLFLALQDFRIGVPGILIQIFGGWVLINKIERLKS